MRTSPFDTRLVRQRRAPAAQLPIVDAWNMERALGIPEILNEILRYTELAALAQMAQTSRRYSKFALDLLWKSSEVYPLLELLSPLNVVEDHWEFANSLYGVDWRRFNGYAQRIRHLDYCDTEKRQGVSAIPSPQLFADIFLHRPMSDGALLPNLTKVEWSCKVSQSLSHLLPFLSPTVKTLHLTLDANINESCADLLKSLTRRGVSLSHFTLCIREYDETLLDSLPTFLASQTELTVARLPPCSATREVVGVLGRLPMLKEYVTWDFVAYRAPMDSDIGMQFDWEAGRYEHLEELSFTTTSLAKASAIVEKRCSPYLRTLMITCRSTLEIGAVRDFTTTLAATYPNITAIHILLFSDSASPQPEALSFNDIRPLLKCTALSTLRLGHNLPMSYTQDDVAEMGAAWPRMRSLQLCEDPTSREGTGQPLQTVLAFARAFTKLETLALYVDMSTVNETPSIPWGLATSDWDVLDFGTSSIDTDDLLIAVNKVALFLARISGPDVSIQSGRGRAHVRTAVPTSESEAEDEAREIFWSDVASTVRAMHLGRKELEEENQAVVRQNRELMGEIDRLKGRDLEEENRAVVARNRALLEEIEMLRERVRLLDLDILKYTIVDAFASSPFSGNPAAVIILEPSTVLSDSLAQKIAAELNLPATAFLRPKSLEGTQNSRTYRLQWFTPQTEIPLCGHGTLASARVLFANATITPMNVNTLKFETLSGTLTAEKVEGGGQIELEFPATTSKDVGPDVFATAAAIVSEATGGSVSVRDVQDAGSYLLVHVEESLDLENISVNASPFSKLTAFKGIILTSNRPSALAPNAKFISRCFGAALGTAEDPVTGSSHCVLAPYWSKVLNIPPGDLILARQVSPRGGDLELVWDKAGGRVKIRGNAVVVARGEMYVG
ncbi:hypothetical protein FRB97_004181 [Tulasnella sp. 331]|nr:hypothetical protein FRB97_004181 [Tulasnella sp. 331]